MGTRRHLPQLLQHKYPFIEGSSMFRVDCVGAMTMVESSDLPPRLRWDGRLDICVSFPFGIFGIESETTRHDTVEAFLAQLIFSHLNLVTNTSATERAKTSSQFIHKHRLPAAVTRQNHEGLGSRRKDRNSLPPGAVQILINRKPSGQC